VGLAGVLLDEEVEDRQDVPAVVGVDGDLQDPRRPQSCDEIRAPESS
jgi:hypothetical protein